MKLPVYSPGTIIRICTIDDMENKKKIPVNTVTRDIRNLAAPTGNIY